MIGNSDGDQVDPRFGIPSSFVVNVEVSNSPMSFEYVPMFVLPRISSFTDPSSYYYWSEKPASPDQNFTRLHRPVLIISIHGFRLPFEDD